MDAHSSSVFPALSPSQRPREFNKYTDPERAAVIYSYLMKGIDYRTMDREVLKITFDSRGFQSMGICHYLGLGDAQKGFFKNWTFDEAILCLKNLEQTDAIYLIIYYLDYARSELLGVDKEYDLILTETKDKFWIKNTLLHSKKEKYYDSTLLELPNEVDSHKLVEVRKDVKCYLSSTILKQSVKSLYDYRCQVCGDVVLKTGWSSTLSRSESWSYLSSDVHHILPLSKGGPDSRDNMICLCPTCHRKFHSGEFRLKEEGSKLILSDELLVHSQELGSKHMIILY